MINIPKSILSEKYVFLQFKNVSCIRQLGENPPLPLFMRTGKWCEKIFYLGGGGQVNIACQEDASFLVIDIITSNDS